MPTISKGSGPIILDKGSAITIVASTGAAGSISIPGEAVAQSVTSGTKYSYGPFSDRREVIIALTNGTAEVTIGSVPSAAFTDAEVMALQAVVGDYSTAPATLNATTGAENNGKTLSLAAGATLTVHVGAWSLLSAGIVIQVGQGGSATLAFSGTATKENASGTSASSVTLAASGVYALTQSPSGSPKFRLTGGAAL